MTRQVVALGQVIWVSDEVVAGTGSASDCHVQVPDEEVPDRRSAPLAPVPTIRQAVVLAQVIWLSDEVPAGSVSGVHVHVPVVEVPDRTTGPLEPHPMARQVVVLGHVIWVSAVTPVGCVAGAQLIEPAEMVPDKITAPVPDPMATQPVVLGQVTWSRLLTPAGGVAALQSDPRAVGLWMAAAPTVPGPYPTATQSEDVQVVDSIRDTCNVFSVCSGDVHVEEESTLTVGSIPVEPSGDVPNGA